MNLYLNTSINNKKYHNNSQNIRVLTEQWTRNNMFCPRCGNNNIEKIKNNSPVADFYCKKCNNIFELKSKNGKISSKIVDGSYDKMIERISSNTNPDFFFMTYNKIDFTINDFIVIPKYFFTPKIIEKRKPLKETARRAGWIGCNILFNKIPNEGKIFIIKNKTKINKEEILKTLNTTSFIKDIKLSNRSWIMDILNCINFLNDIFSLSDIYNFELELKNLHPENNYIKNKIRQQLQFLRDKNYIEFLGKGKYRKRA